jgi:hemerythrin-like domain-containing protein
MPKPTEMLREDHEKVKELFERFEDADEGEQQEIANTAMQEIQVHSTLEEELFYPAAREVLEQESEEEGEVLDESLEEHHVVDLIMAELRKMRSNDERFKAKFTVMAENVKHHIEEEENELFPKVEGQLEDEDLAQQMMERKEELQQKMQSGSRSRATKSKSSSGSTSRTRGKRSSGTKGRKKAASGRR